MSTIVMAGLSVVVIVVIGWYQYDSAKEEIQWGDQNKVLIIAKRVALFFLASVVAILLVLYAGGGGSHDENIPERRWESGRG